MKPRLSIRSDTWGWGKVTGVKFFQKLFQSWFFFFYFLHGRSLFNNIEESQSVKGILFFCSLSKVLLLPLNLSRSRFHPNVSRFSSLSTILLISSIMAHGKIFASLTPLFLMILCSNSKVWSFKRVLRTEGYFSSGDSCSHICNHRTCKFLLNLSTDNFLNNEKRH